MRKKVTKTAITVITAFLLLKVVNLFLADIAFNKGYRANLAEKYERAIWFIEQAISLNRHEPTYYRELADSYCMLGQTDPCLRNASLALRLNPQNSLTLKALAKTFIRAGLLENAKIMSGKLLELCPTDEESRQIRNYLERSIL